MVLINNEDIESAANDKLSKNVALLLENSNISASELARKLGLPYNTIQRLLSGSTSDPRMSTLTLIADYFNVSLDQLTGHRKENRDTNTQSVPIFGWDEIGKINLMDINSKSYNSVEPIAFVESQKLGLRAYALESRRYMQPRFPIGTIFIIDPDETPIDGDLVVVKIKATDEVSLRDLSIDPPHYQLSPVIGNAPSLVYDHAAHDIIGVVIITKIHTRNI